RFVTRLFEIGAEAAAIAAATRDQDDLFRFKVDFVRRRALPLLKGGAHVEVTPEDEAIVARLSRGSAESAEQLRVDADLELRIARAGCALLDREKTDKAAVAAEIEALRRWCAARVDDPAYRPWVIFRFPENVEPWSLVAVQRPNPQLPEEMIGPDSRLRRRDGFKLTDARWKSREVLSEIHYCVLCHERDKDSCSKGLHETSKGA